MTRVLIVDDHPVFRAGLAALLAADGQDVVGEAAGVAEGVSLVAALRPDLVVMDLALPDGSGIAATARITSTHPSVRLLVLTLFDDDGSVREALAAGATGYVVKDATPAQLLAAVRAVAEGATVLGTGVPAALAGTTDPDLGLSPRERQVADLLVKGLPNRIIAERLGIAGKTVANLVSAVIAKTGASDRVEAAQVLRGK